MSANRLSFTLLNLKTMRKVANPLIFLLMLIWAACSTQKDKAPVFKVSFTKEMSEQAQDGRLLLLLANNNKSEPRFQINDGLSTQLVFGIDVEGMKPGRGDDHYE